MRELEMAPAVTEMLGDLGSVRLVENQTQALISLAVPTHRLAPARAYMLAEYGLDLAEPGKLVTDLEGIQTAFWMARSQWMLERPEALDANWARTIASQHIGFVTEQTGAWVRLDLHGQHLAPIFQRLANVPSHRLVQSVALRTAIHHLGVFILCRGSYVSIYGPRSSADSLVRAVVFAVNTVQGLERAG